MGIMFHAIQKKGYVIIAQKYLFHQAWAAPSVIVGNVGDRLRVYLFGVPPTATDLLEILILENHHDEETLGKKIDWLI